jgi:hypothetical protein
MNTMKYISEQNQYQINNTLKQKLNEGNTSHQHNNKKQDKWTTLSYFGKELGKVANIFRDNNIKTEYKTTNTIQNQVKIKQYNNNQYENSGVYSLKRMSSILHKSNRPFVQNMI